MFRIQEVRRQICTRAVKSKNDRALIFPLPSLHLLQKLSSVARWQIDVTEQLIPWNGATQVPEWRLEKDEALEKRYQETIDTDNNAGYVRKTDQIELDETKTKDKCICQIILSLKCKKLKSPKEFATQQQSIKAKHPRKPAATSNRNYFSFPITTNSLISRHRRKVFLKRRPKQRQSITMIFLARRSRAEDRNLQVHSTRFYVEKLADLCKLLFAPSGEG